MRVRCEPSGRTVELRDGETLYAGLRRVGVPVASSCRADGICGRCGLRILEGEVEPPSAQEARTLERNRVAEGLRLSCLVVPRGDLVVRADYW